MNWGEWFGEKELATQAGKADAAGRAGKPKDEVIAGIAASRGGDERFLLAELSQDCLEWLPRPTVQLVFAGELCPGGDDGKDSDLGPKFFGEFEGVGFCEQGGVELLAGGLEEGGAYG